MTGTMQVCLYNMEPESSEQILSQIQALNFVRVTAEAATAEDLDLILEGTDVSLAFMHLDPKPEEVVELIDHISQRFPEVAMIALSHETAPESILAPIRAGCDQFVCEPINYAELANAVARVANRRLLKRPKSRCICTVGASGGTGATSIACNLAMEIAQLTGKKCALVDTDFQFGDIAAHFDCEPKYTFRDVAASAANLDRSILESVLTHLSCEVAILARPENVEHCEVITSDVVHHTIELLNSMFESIVVDVPRRIDPVTFAVLSQADLILIVCQLLVPGIRNANRYFQSLAHLGLPAERVEVVVNRGDSSGGRIAVKDIEELIRKPVFACIPNDYQFVARSLDFGQPVASHERSSPVRNELRKMAAKILSDAGSDQIKPETRRGLFSRLLSK